MPNFSNPNFPKTMLIDWIVKGCEVSSKRWYTSQYYTIQDPPKTFTFVSYDSHNCGYPSSLSDLEYHSSSLEIQSGATTWNKNTGDFEVSIPTGLTGAGYFIPYTDVTWNREEVGLTN